MFKTLRSITLPSFAFALSVVACAPSEDDAALSQNDETTDTSATLSSGTVVTLVAQHSAKCVDVPSNATTVGLQLQQYTCNNTDAQKFKITQNANASVSFVNVHSGLCIDLRQDATANGTAIQQATCAGSESQNFALKTMSAGVYQVRTAHNACLDVSHVSKDNGALMQAWGCGAGTNQQFAIAAATTTTVPPTGPVKYLSALGARCNGTDDSAAVSAAITGAHNKAYTLIVDCAATLDIGLHIDRSVFIDDDTTVEFQGNGKFIVNNLFEPAFVIANTANVTLTNWNVEFNASMPTSFATGGYYLGGTFVTNQGSNGAGAFNDKVLSDWLHANRGINWVDGRTHGIWAHWMGSVNASAIFYIIGDTTNLKVTGLNLYSANLNQPADYVPFGFQFGLGFKSNQDVTVNTVTYNAQNASEAFDVPRNVTFDHVTLDGIVMGFQGTTSNATFSNITAKHVSDLQDADGSNVGGVGQNFPPPHLFYLNYGFDGDPRLANTAIKISNVNEVGPRLGGLRPGGGGYADSLKLGCNNCSVDGYKTNRKDGFMDVLTSNGLTVSNVVATYDSSFVDVYEKWPAWRWPGGGTSAAYKNVTFSNVSLTDLAAESVAGPLSNNTSTANTNIVMTNVNLTVQSWTKGNIVPKFVGLAANSEVTFTLLRQNEKQYLKP